MKRTRENDPDIIVFDVAGRRYTCARATLARSPPGILCDLFGDDAPVSSISVTEDGSMYLDRDPAAFAAVLRHVRGDPVFVPADSTPSLTTHELKYFFVDPPRVWTNDAYMFAHHRVTKLIVAAILESTKTSVVQRVRRDGGTPTDGTNLGSAFLTGFSRCIVWSDGNGGINSADITMKIDYLQYPEDAFESDVDEAFSALVYDTPNRQDIVDALCHVLGATRGYMLPFREKKKTHDNIEWLYHYSLISLECDTNSGFVKTVNSNI